MQFVKSILDHTIAGGRGVAQGPRVEGTRGSSFTDTPISSAETRTRENIEDSSMWNVLTSAFSRPVPSNTTATTRISVHDAELEKATALGRARGESPTSVWWDDTGESCVSTVGKTNMLCTASARSEYRVQRENLRESKAIPCSSNFPSVALDFRTDVNAARNGPIFSEQDVILLQATYERAESLQQALDAAEVQRTKMIGNLKSRKAMLLQAKLAQERLQAQLASFGTREQVLREENDSLRVGLQNVAAVRDDLRNKLRIQKDTLKEALREKEAVHRQLIKCLYERELESHLLGQYRRLSLQTGYFKWGKEIREAEAKLAASVERDG